MTAYLRFQQRAKEHLAAALIPVLQIRMGEVINPYAELYGRLGWF
jgi:hypothetical protein